MSYLLVNLIKFTLQQAKRTVNRNRKAGSNKIVKY